MNSLTVFQFDQAEVKVVVDETGKPWFNASDCARALGYSNPSEAIRDHVSSKHSKTLDLGLPGRKPLFITEPALYQLVMRSNLPSAERFQDWVFEEVLPSIRKTGQYQINPPTPAEMLLGMAQQLVDQERRLKDSESQLNSLLENQRRAEQELTALPEATVAVAPKTARAKVSELVRNYVARTNASYREVWRKLYKEMFYRCHYNATQRAENRGMKPMDVIEQDGMGDALLAIACELLK